MSFFVLQTTLQWGDFLSPIGLLVLFVVALIITLIIISLVTQRPISFSLGKNNFSIGGKDDKSPATKELEKKIGRIEEKLIQDARKLEFLFEELGELPGFKEKLDFIQKELQESNEEKYAWEDIGNWMKNNHKKLVRQGVKKVCSLPEHKNSISKKTPENLTRAYSKILDFIRKKYANLEGFTEEGVTRFIQENVNLTGRDTTLFPKLFRTSIDYILSEEEKGRLNLSSEAKEELIDNFSDFEEGVSVLLIT